MKFMDRKDSARAQNWYLLPIFGGKVQGKQQSKSFIFILVIIVPYFLF